DRDLLKTLVPPNALNAENFQELAGKTYVEEVAAGKAIFKQGDVDKQSVYVLEGEVAMTSSDGRATSVKSGSPTAKHPIGNFQ
ncbi:MAG: cyclic nucleotide-binding protein, partial [Gammaproteobacteria bacterium]|nr:cyclic nucleotide-binding protein [Gammaproteobacteria bacterium]NIO63432.1 cyclic nucleotide-binding protein [Gammaproteobacteria bacterium]